MIISLQNLYKRFNYSWIIENANFEFQGNHVYGLQGPNGSGKSTLLQIISGFLTPSKGTLKYVIGDMEVERPDIYQYVAISAPYVSTIEEYTVSELLDMYKKLKPLQAELSTDLFLEESYLLSDRLKPIKYFSSGMKQRLQLLLALKTNCPILLLDEPSSFLDDDARGWFYQKLSENRKDKLVIIASNDKEDLNQCQTIIDLHTIQDKASSLVTSRT